VRGYAGTGREAAASVYETQVYPLAYGAQSALEAGHVGGVDPDPVDLTRGNGDERDRVGVGEHCVGETLALRAPETLAVVQLLENLPALPGGKPLEIEENARGHDRAGPGRTTHLVDAGDQVNATSEVVGNESRLAHP